MLKILPSSSVQDYTKILLQFGVVFLFLVFCNNSIAQQKPNIIFILADDLGYGDLGCYGSEKIKTPNIDALAKNGIRFTNCYSGSTVCAPSRAALMTGLHTGHASIRGNGEIPLQATDSILPQYLKTTNYTNGMVGKWGLGQATTTGSPEKKGWDFFSGLLHHVEGHYQLPDSAWQMIEGKSKKIKIPGNTFSNEWFKNEAIRFIDEQKTNPFFLYISFTLPHAEILAPQKFLQQYLNKDGTSKFEPEIPNKSNQHYGVQEYPKAMYAAMISQMDAYVGEIIALLKSKGLIENTIIIFSSDNGTHAEGGRTKKDVEYFKSSGNLRGIKRDLYEGGIRVPFIIQWNNNKNIQKNSINKNPIAFWDILPTVTAIAGVNTTIRTDGISLINNLTVKAVEKARIFYWEFYENGFKQAIRFGKWKAIRFYQGKIPIRTELYNLDIDEREQMNVANENLEIVAHLESLLDKEHITAEHPKFQIK